MSSQWHSYGKRSLERIDGGISPAIWCLSWIRKFDWRGNDGRMPRATSGCLQSDAREKLYARGIVTGSLNVNDEEAAHLQRETETPVCVSVNPFGTCQ